VGDGEGLESYPLPENGPLAEVAIALRDTGHWAFVVDHRWQVVYMTDELRRTFGAGELAEHAPGTHFFGPEALEASRKWRFGPNTDDHQRTLFSVCGNLVLADADGDREAVRAAVDPLFHDLVDALEPTSQTSLGAVIRSTKGTGSSDVHLLVMRVTDAAGRLVGSAIITKPPIGMRTMSAMLDELDPGHLERMQDVARPARRPAAILFADLEGSSQLARRLATSTYFSLGRRLVRAADRCVIDAGGLVGRHVGDGVVAFFLVETAGSESAAARACITAARTLRAAVDEVAVRSDVAAGDVVLRFGLHWGSTLYVGNISTRGRSEVTALGDEVNEAARIEACATGGRALASKDLIERLDHDDATALGLDPLHLAYTALRDLDTATEKARRDAPAIPVCDI
jgi:class 3 adenylate cyclase